MCSCEDGIRCRRCREDDYKRWDDEEIVKDQKEDIYEESRRKQEDESA